MPDKSNVYAAPKAPLTGGGAPGDISEGILENLRRTRPWVLLIAVLLFIGAVFTVIAAISMAVVGTIGGQQAGLPAAMGIGMGVGYLVSGVIYLFLGIYLVKRSGLSASSADVEEAIGHQRSFWRLTGILALFAILFMVAIIASVVIGGFAGGMMAH